MGKALAKRNVAINKRKRAHISREQVIMIAAAAGLVSALLPSVPTIVKFWQDETEVSFFGIKTKYNSFLKVWVIASAIGLGYIFWRIKKK